MRILVVEDDERLGELLVRALREEAFAVDLATDGHEAEWNAFENTYDLILLDLMLPRKDGLSVLKTLRQSNIKTPVLILTAKDTTTDIVSGLDSGADDYLKKPFSIEELLARVRALLRRPQEGDVGESVKHGPFVIHPAKKEILMNNTPLELTTKEYALMEYFIRHPNTVLSRTQLSEHVWDDQFEPHSNVVDVYVGYLRNKVDKSHATDYIKTVRGHGYMLNIENHA